MTRTPQILLRVAILAAVLATGRAGAAGGTVADQAVSLSYPAIHWGTTVPFADLAGVDATGDQVYAAGVWYRAEGDTREHPMPAPDTETYSNGTITSVWNDLDGKGFSVMETTWVFDREGPSGGFVSVFSVKNLEASARSFTLFHFLDADLAGTATGDTGGLLVPGFLKFAEGGSKLTYRFEPGPAVHYQVASGAALPNALNASGLTDLADTGLPFGPGDATVATEFGPTLVPGGGAYYLIVATVSASFNDLQDHVKGDSAGLQMRTLVAQGVDLAPGTVTFMRRTQQLSWHSSVAVPFGAAVAGVDDFDGDYKDEFAARDLSTGAAYVGNQPITGAATLALTWKLSATGDFNADGKADILWRNTTSQKLVIWTMNGNAKTGNIVPSPDQAVDANWEVAAAADFNADGYRDLLWYNQTSGKIVLWLMNGSVQRITGLFTNPATVGNNNWKVLAAGDFGKGPGGLYGTQDVVWQNDTSKKVVVWFMDLSGNRTGGTFTSPDTLANGWNLVGPR